MTELGSTYISIYLGTEIGKQDRKGQIQHGSEGSFRIVFWLGFDHQRTISMGNVGIIITDWPLFRV